MRFSTEVAPMSKSVWFFHKVESSGHSHLALIEYHCGNLIIRYQYMYMVDEQATKYFFTTLEV